MAPVSTPCSPSSSHPDPPPHANDDEYLQSLLLTPIQQPRRSSPPRSSPGIGSSTPRPPVPVTWAPPHPHPLLHHPVSALTAPSSTTSQQSPLHAPPTGSATVSANTPTTTTTRRRARSATPSDGEQNQSVEESDPSQLLLNLSRGDNSLLHPHTHTTKRRRVEVDRSHDGEMRDPTASNAASGSSAAEGMGVGAGEAAMQSNGNGFTNGHGSTGEVSGEAGASGVDGATNGSARPTGLPWPGHTQIKRDELVRLLVQGLKEVGYPSAATALESESGYKLDPHPDVTAFREGVLHGKWNEVEVLLKREEAVLLEAGEKGAGKGALGIQRVEEVREARFIVAQQKYLELLEAGHTKRALSVLRNEVTPLASLASASATPSLVVPSNGNVNALSLMEGMESEEASGAAGEEDSALKRLSVLSSFLMCGSPEEVRTRSGWEGVAGGTRLRVMSDMQALIPPTHLVPHNRLLHVLNQSFSLQTSECSYHLIPRPLSLLSDHFCPPASFPSVTTHVLRQHSDEVWRIEWTRDGKRLASAGKDGKCIIWKLLWEGIGAGGKDGGEGAEVELEVQFVLEGHGGNHTLGGGSPSGVCAIAWSPDGSALLTASDVTVNLWNSETGGKIFSMTKHDYEISALAWLPDGQTFVSGAMDHVVLAWNLKGETVWSWTASPTRILDLAPTPDGRSLIAIGMADEPIPRRPGDEEHGPGNPQITEKVRKVLCYDLQSGEVKKWNVQRETTCVSVSEDSKYALINTSPDEVHLWSLEDGRLVSQYSGQKQGNYIIKSCFAGHQDSFILSGSEDGNVYAWHREFSASVPGMGSSTGKPVMVLSGHKSGTVVNAVAWNPRKERGWPALFASAGDDGTIRIWQSPDAGVLPASVTEMLS